MASTAYNSRAFSNGLARQFYKNYDDMSALGGGVGLQSTNKMFFGFFQNKQAVDDINTWNSWILNDSRTGHVPTEDDTSYPQYFNTDVEINRNKFLYMVPATNILMVEKNSSGTIEYNGQRWEEVSTWNEYESTTDDEPRYLYLEADLRYYDGTLAISDHVSGGSANNIITGLGLYKVSIDDSSATCAPNTFAGTCWTSVDYDSAVYNYLYYYNSNINTGATNTYYEEGNFGTSNLVFLYQNTFPAVVRTTSLLTKFSLIIEF